LVLFEKVLVPLDGSKTSEGILPYVAALAERFGSRISLLTVIDPDALDVPEKLGDLYSAWEAAVRKQLAKAAEELRAKVPQVEHEVAHGKAAHEILAHASRKQCGLIAMSTRGRGLLGWGMLGSVAYNVIHMSPVPVLTIAPEKAEHYSHACFGLSTVSVPLDGSKLAEQALPAAEALAARLSASIVLMRVVPSVEVLPLYLTGTLPMQLHEAAKAEAAQYLKDVEQRLRRKGLEVTVSMYHGSASAELVRVLRDTQNNIVVMTSHGRSNTFSEVLGSVVLSVVRDSGDPVLIIPARGG